MMAQKIVVVTGTSTGIGQAAVNLLAERGYTVFATVRKPEDGEQYAANPNINPLLMDVTDPDTIKAAAETVQSFLQPGDSVVGLVNNAGIAVGAPISHVSLRAVRKQFEVNVIGLIAVTQAFLPLLQADTPGRVVNIGSVAGLVTSPFLGIYSASKHAVEAISDALRREQMPFGVKVSLVEPGPIATPIWDKGIEKAVEIYSNTPYAPIVKKMFTYFVNQGKNGLSPQAVAAVILTALEAPNPKTRYLITPGKFQFLLSKWMPDKMLDRTIYKQLGMDEVAKNL